MQAEFHALYKVERPEVVRTVSWAASNGDRSENGDYIYGRKRLREIDGKLNRLSKKMKHAQVLDPAEQIDRSRIFFGATVALADEDDERLTVTLVGHDEADPAQGRISWTSPLAKALRRATVGDLRTVPLPSGPKEWEVMHITYPDRR